ncbi:MAG: hypothetical protein WCZ12_01625 [Patescibacteria group bacterium]
MKKIFLKKILIGSSLFLFVFCLTSTTSASLIDTTSTTTDGMGQVVTKYAMGDYELNDVLRVGVRVTKIILGVVGSLALLFFVYGGIMFLISAGSSDKVSKAKGIIVNAVIGLAIVFLSYLIVQFVMNALTATGRGGLN